MCKKCGSIISPYLALIKADNNDNEENQVQFWTCKLCDSPENIVKVAIPFVLQYLVAELAAVNIKVKFTAN